MTPEDRVEFAESLPPTAPKNHEARRRLLRGGLAAAPALLTLVNRPVMAGACRTMSAGISGNMSRAGQTAALCSGASPVTWSQDAAAGDWPAPVAVPDTVNTIAAPTSTDGDISEKPKEIAGGPSTLKDSPVLDDGLKAEAVGAKGLKTVRVPGTLFDSVFGKQRGYPKATLTEVLRMNTHSGRDGLARYLVAAYLNALRGLTPSEVLDVPTIKNIWTSFVARGYYEPTAGIRWFPDYSEPANGGGGLIAWLRTTMPR